MEKEFLGDFQIVRLIGRGPLGMVYLAEHRFLKKRFALKVLPAELMEDDKFRERFEKEIEAFGKLSHMNLVKVHTVSADKGIYFIVNDFIADSTGDSRNLSQYLSGLKERLTEEEIVSILKQVAYALDYMHGVSVEHREFFHGSLKLSNILIGKSDEGRPHIYLSDMGVAPIIGSGRILSKVYQTVAKTLETDHTITPFGSENAYTKKCPEEKSIAKMQFSFLQTYAFLAPEQKLGGDEKASAKADIYAFGILAYFLLMGYMPEGVFLMPSESGSHFTYNWDLLIKKTLCQNPHHRMDNLKDLLEKIVPKELASVAPSLGRYQVEEEEEEAEQIRVVERPRFKEVTPASRDFVEEKRALPPKATRESYSMYGEEEAVAVMEEEKEPLKKPVLEPSVLKKYEYEEDPGAIFQTQKIVVPYRPKEKEVRNLEPMRTEMIVIEGMEYHRGSNVGARDEKPRHKVELSSFAIDIHPVTNEQFSRFLDVMGSEKDSNNNDTILLKESRIKRQGGKLTIESGYAKHPVVGVSWYGARAYADWIGKRLPTEAEWEIAASCGLEENVYPSGEEIERTQANFFSSDTTAVMSYKPNRFGLYDMAGNVYEWCEDWYGYNFYETSMQEPFNPKGPPQGVYRVLRGGCWKSLKEDMRCSHRHRNNPGSLNRTYGFRCAANVA